MSQDKRILIEKIIDDHNGYRSQTLNLSASENMVSPTVRRYLASDLGNRYSTYYDDPSERNYTGQKTLIDIELKTQQIAKEIFKSEFIDFRPLGGHMAGISTILSFMKPGDTMFENSVFDGGHCLASRLKSAPFFNNLFNIEDNPIDSETYNIDIQNMMRLVKEKKPSLVIFGFSTILFPEPLNEIVDQLKNMNITVVYDASHVLGLIGGKTFPNPLDQGVDLISTSHHKTFFGPQGGVLLSNSEEIFSKARKGLYPPLVGNHHMHRLPSIMLSLYEMKEYGEMYAKQTIKNSKKLGAELYNYGIDVLYPDKNFTQTHILLVDVSDIGNADMVSTQILDKAGIISIGVYLPRDKTTKNDTKSGIRLGTAEITRMGMKESDMGQIAEFFKKLLIDKKDKNEVEVEIKDYVKKFNKIDFSYDQNTDPYNF